MSAERLTDDELAGELRRIAREIQRGVRIAHGNPPPAPHDGPAFTEAAQSALADADLVLEGAKRLRRTELP